jgi:hypothetical protein
MNFKRSNDEAHRYPNQKRSPFHRMHHVLNVVQVLEEAEQQAAEAQLTQAELAEREAKQEPDAGAPLRSNLPSVTESVGVPKKAVSEEVRDTWLEKFVVPGTEPSSPQLQYFNFGESGYKEGIPLNGACCDWNPFVGMLPVNFSPKTKWLVLRMIGFGDGMNDLHWGMTGEFCQDKAAEYARRKIEPLLRDLHQEGFECVDVTWWFDGDTIGKKDGARSNFTAEIPYLTQALQEVAATLHMTVVVNRFVICKILKESQKMTYQSPDVISKYEDVVRSTGSDLFILTAPFYDQLKAEKKEIRNYWGVELLKQLKRWYPMLSVHLLVTGGGDVVGKELDQLELYPLLVDGATLEQVQRHDRHGKNETSKTIADIVAGRKKLGCKWTLVPPRN